MSGSGELTPITTISNSYLTISELETRLAGDPRSSAIALLAASDASQTWYLLRASKSIDQLPFIGVKYLDTQALQHPRKFIINPETDSPWGTALSIDAYGFAYDTAVPEVIKAATMEESVSLYSEYASTSVISESDLQAKGVESFTLGKLSMSFAPGSASQHGSMRSKYAYDMIVASGYVEMAPLIQ